MSLSSPSAHPIRDLVRTELQDGWHRFDRMMEDSELLGSGPNGSAMEFTQWDGMKRAASDAAKEGRKDVQVLRSRAAQASQVALPPFFTLPAYRRPDTLLASQALTNPYPSLSTPSLSHDATLHSRFAEQYLTYAGRDAKEAARQAGMAGREVFEVGRRKVIGTDGDAVRASSSRARAGKAAELRVTGSNPRETDTLQVPRIAPDAPERLPYQRSHRRCRCRVAGYWH
ncbi:hypothetical protein AAT19DRAFT_14873 [Rhodotorula toruloides]|uniref:Uncharacterized protein n=1 Tax=Rhodotorula toruloides TaxID=5286 RepID=A0A2T0A923_RHOTO|nr:hypothetical protein AAT19DRAFT_14873 [Rhodotorula toruloides]